MKTPPKERAPNPGGSHRDKLKPGAGNRTIPVPNRVTIRSKRNRNAESTTPVQVRLPPDDLAVLDAVVDHTRKAGLSVSRASVLADLVPGLLDTADSVLEATGTLANIPRSPDRIGPLCALHYPGANMSEACRRRIQRGRAALEGCPDDEWVAKLTRAMLVCDSMIAEEDTRDKGRSQGRGNRHTGVRVTAPQKRFLDKCAELMAPAEGAPRPVDAPDAFANRGCFYAGSMALILVYGAHALSS